MTAVDSSGATTAYLGDTPLSMPKFPWSTWAGGTFTVIVGGDYVRSFAGASSMQGVQFFALHTLGTIVASQRLDTSYNALGQIATVTSYNLAESGSVLNQVQRQYNGFGQLTREYQAHDGAVSTSGSLTTLSVQYAYADAAHGSRLSQMTYPDGTTIVYNYSGNSAGSLNDVISRLDNLSQGTVTLESYKYLGPATVIERDHPQDGVHLTYIGTLTLAGTVPAGDIYGGLDRFGRVIDQKWTTGTNGGSGTIKDEYVYTYDRDGNVTAKLNWAILPPLSADLFDESYTYDGLNRLTAITRGGSAYQSFALDAVGNITGVTGITGNHTRTSNALNQLTSDNFNPLTYDANGNLATDDQGRIYIYDAWNRLIAVENSDATLIVAYSYDGLGRLITQYDASLTRTDSYFAGTQEIQLRAGVSAADNGAVIEEDVYSPVYTNAILLRHSGTASTYFTSDANFNVTGAVETTGTMIQHQVYDAYGKVKFTDDDWTAQSGDTLQLSHLFQGMLLHVEIGWYYAGQSNLGRWYGPDEMIWIRPDAGYIDGPALYQPYAANPINRVDPSGLASKIRDRVHAALVDFQSKHQGYLYYEADGGTITGLMSMIWDKLNPSLYWLGDGDYIEKSRKGLGSQAKYYYIMNDLEVDTAPLDPDDMFHEVIHVYNDWKDQNDGPARVDEGVAYAAAGMAKGLEQGLQPLERELAKPQPDSSRLIILWQRVWSTYLDPTKINGTYDSDVDFRVDWMDVDRVKNEYGFSISATKLADLYNDEAVKKGLCVYFTTDVNYPVHGVIPASPLEPIDPHLL